MTPHYGKWYEQGGEIADPAKEPEKVPADWHDPVPVPFLVVKSAKFLFGIAPRRAQFQGEVKGALEALKNALEWLGAGAKTAVGYGRMQETPLDLFRSAWVDQAIQDIKARNRSSENEALRGKQLADAWQALPDGPEKQAALKDIRSRWEKEGWWENPPGKAKAIKQIYLG